jgi:hypothetical protein
VVVAVVEDELEHPVAGIGRRVLRPPRAAVAVAHPLEVPVRGASAVGAVPLGERPNVHLGGVLGQVPVLDGVAGVVERFPPDESLTRTGSTWLAATNAPANCYGPNARRSQGGSIRG